MRAFLKTASHFCEVWVNFLTLASTQLQQAVNDFSVEVVGAGPAQVFAASGAFSLHLLQTLSGLYKVDVFLVTSAGTSGILGSPYQVSRHSRKQEPPF